MSAAASMNFGERVRLCAIAFIALGAAAVVVLA